MTDLKLFETASIRSFYDEVNEKWYFSIVDVIEALTDSINPTDYLKKLRKRDSELGNFLGTNCPQIAMVNKSGVKRKTLAGTNQDLLRLIQSIPSPKAEPFKQWLAQIGAEIANNKNAQGFIENRKAANAGGTVAGNARKELEKKSGAKVVSKENFKKLDSTKELKDNNDL